MNKKILIVEDESLISSVLSKKLTGSGFDVLIASDGEDGLEKALKIPI